jgi:hypothetical protein
MQAAHRFHAGKRKRRYADGVQRSVGPQTRQGRPADPPLRRRENRQSDGWCWYSIEQSAFMNALYLIALDWLARD